jgi:hypothetical protein
MGHVFLQYLSRTECHHNLLNRVSYVDILSNGLLTHRGSSYRIWRVNMSVTRGIGSQSLLPVMVIVLESGALYSSMVFVLLMTYVSNSYAQVRSVDLIFIGFLLSI